MLFVVGLLLLLLLLLLSLEVTVVDNIGLASWFVCHSFAKEIIEETEMGERKKERKRERVSWISAVCLFRFLCYERERETTLTGRNEMLESFKRP